MSGHRLLALGAAQAAEAQPPVSRIPRRSCKLSVSIAGAKGVAAANIAAAAVTPRPPPGAALGWPRHRVLTMSSLPVSTAVVRRNSGPSTTVAGTDSTGQSWPECHYIYIISF